MRFLLLTIAMLLVVSPVVAANYSEDFESYTPGTLNMPGYPGWWGNGSWNVVDGSALNGTKAITPNGAYDLNITDTGTTFANGTVASINVRMSTDVGSFFSWNVMNDEAPFIGLCWYTDGLFRYATEGYGWNTDLHYTMYQGDSYLLSAVLNFTGTGAQTVAYSVSDLTDPTRSFAFNTPFGLPTTTASAANGVIYLSGVGSEFDNITVSTVPEPSALVALGTGLMGICGFSIHRRK